MTARVCSVPGCPNLVDRGRCEAHATRRPSSPSRNHHGISPSRRGHGYDYQRARAALLEDGPLCAWGCGRPATTADYAIPWSRGGTIDDLVPACGRCNYSRRSMVKR